MREDRLSEWVSGREAAAIISANSGHEVSQRYIRALAAHNQITTRIIDGRTKLYLRRDVERYVVDTKRGPKPGARQEKEAA
jgi:hypothetical protein